MNRGLYFLAIIIVFLSAACAGADDSARLEEVVIDDGYKTTSANEIIIDDEDLEGKGQTISASNGGSRDMTKIAADNSKISVMFDRFGNKTETRNFNYHPRLAFILMRTSADGKRKVFVYGQNGEVNGLPENMLDRVLTASAEEIANAANIREIVRAAPTLAQNNQSPENVPLRPLPSSNFPVQTPPAPPIPVEEPAVPQQPAADTADETPEEEKETPTREKTESVTINKKP